MWTFSDDEIESVSKEYDVSPLRAFVAMCAHADGRGTLDEMVDAADRGLRDAKVSNGLPIRIGAKLMRIRRADPEFEPMFEAGEARGLSAMRPSNDPGKRKRIEPPRHHPVDVAERAHELSCRPADVRMRDLYDRLGPIVIEPPALAAAS